MTTDTAPASTPQVKEKISQIRELPLALRWVPATVTVLLMMMTLDYLFNWGLLTFVTGLETQFYYAVVALLLRSCFCYGPCAAASRINRFPGMTTCLALSR